MLSRDIKPTLIRCLGESPLVILSGSRGCGKTTLLTESVDGAYVSLLDVRLREHANADPIGFLHENHQSGGCQIIDDVHYAPKLASKIGEFYRSRAVSGVFLLGSAQKPVTSAHSAGFLCLDFWTLSASEAIESGILPARLDTVLFGGMYPAVLSGGEDPLDWYSSYICSFLESALPIWRQVDDPSVFFRFMKACASRVGQVLNLSAIGEDCGISHTTAKTWLDVLVEAFLVYLVPPHSHNFGKRKVKTSKLYFSDTGLACHLLGVRSAKELAAHYLRGKLFESFVVGELHKQRSNAGLSSSVSFWSDKRGKGVDCVLEWGGGLCPVDISVGATLSSDSFAGLDYWSRLVGRHPSEGVLVYGGGGDRFQSRGRVLGWREVDRLFPAEAMV